MNTNTIDDEVFEAMREQRCALSRIRRHRLAEAKICINGKSHGRATHGVRCLWCDVVHKRGVAVAHALKIAKPPGYGEKRTRR